MALKNLAQIYLHSFPFFWSLVHIVILSIQTYISDCVLQSRSKGNHKSLNVEPVLKLGSNLFGCIGGLRVFNIRPVLACVQIPNQLKIRNEFQVDGKEVKLEGSEQKCGGCKACRARSSRLTSTHSYLSNDVRRTKSWPSFLLNNNV